MKPDTEHHQDPAFRWNERAHQPHRTVDGLRRRFEYLRHAGSYLRMAATAARALPRAWQRYRELVPRMFKTPRDLAGGFGLSIDGGPGELDRTLRELSLLDPPSVLLRAPVWDLARLPACRVLLESTRAAGRSAAVAVLQDRRSALDPAYWRDALDRIFGELAPVCADFEIGHAWNRLKWGVRTVDEYLRLVAAADEARRPYPGLRLAGPAVIDFEYGWTLAALHHRDHAPRFDTVSGLLYVDRRGAPENRQLGFDLPRKAALLRAIADTSGHSTAPVWITETNYPLKVGGNYAPTAVQQGYEPGQQADFLVRYYLNALASGMVERVYWWQMAAPGYGLIDDRDGRWERRPAWHAWRTMNSLLRDARLADATIADGFRRLTFTTATGTVTTAWATGDRRAEVPLPHPVARVLDRDGRAADRPPGPAVAVGPSPLYLLDC